MNRLILIAFASCAISHSPAAAKQTAPLSLTCDAGDGPTESEPANLHGLWDFLMVPRGTPSFGVMSIGYVGSDYGGSLAPTRTAPVVLRGISIVGSSVSMTVASREGDVHFDGKLSAKGDFLCGNVTYHGGETFPMIAQKRPMTYQSPSQVERTRQNSRP